MILTKDDDVCVYLHDYYDIQFYFDRASIRSLTMCLDLGSTTTNTCEYEGTSLIKVVIERFRKV